MIDKSHFEQLQAKAIDDSVQQLVVGGVIQQNDTVLLLQRPDGDFMGGIFELPSGKVEAREPLDIALIREVKEETGLQITGIPDYLGSFDYASSSGKKSRQFNFTVNVDPSEQVELQEHDAYAWVALHDEPPVTDAVKQVLNSYRELVSRPFS